MDETRGIRGVRSFDEWDKKIAGRIAGKANARRNVSHRHADSSSNFTAEDAEERRDARCLGVSLRPLRFITCRMSHGSNIEETRIKDEILNRSKQRKQRRMPDLCFLCCLLLIR